MNNRPVKLDIDSVLLILAVTAVVAPGSLAVTTRGALHIGQIFSLPVADPSNSNARLDNSAYAPKTQVKLGGCSNTMFFPTRSQTKQRDAQGRVQNTHQPVGQQRTNSQGRRR